MREAVEGRGGHQPLVQSQIISFSHERAQSTGHQSSPHCVPGPRGWQPEYVIRSRGAGKQQEGRWTVHGAWRAREKRAPGTTPGGLPLCLTVATVWLGAVLLWRAPILRGRAVRRFGRSLSLVRAARAGLALGPPALLPLSGPSSSTALRLGATGRGAQGSFSDVHVEAAAHPGDGPDCVDSPAAPSPRAAELTYSGGRSVGPCSLWEGR